MTPSWILKIKRCILPVPDADDTLNPVFQKYKDALAAIRLMPDVQLVGEIAELSKELLDESADRRDHIDSHAEAVVNTAGINLAVLGGLAALLVPALSGPYSIGFASLVIALSLFYLQRSIHAAMQVYNVVREVLGPIDLVPSRDQNRDAFVLEIGSQRIAYAIENYQKNIKASGWVRAARLRMERGMGLLWLLVLGLGVLGFYGEITKSNDAKVTAIQLVCQPLTPESPSKSTLPKPKTPVPCPSSPPDPASPSNQPKKG